MYSFGGNNSGLPGHCTEQREKPCLPFTQLPPVAMARVTIVPRLHTLPCDFLRKFMLSWAHPSLR